MKLHHMTIGRKLTLSFGAALVLLVAIAALAVGAALAGLTTRASVRPLRQAVDVARGVAGPAGPGRLIPSPAHHRKETPWTS